ncbi:macrophage mannose receptor 1-like [Uloborus diversus]|uniref:macrophage mannose receptor 1-like n=1 Tax=Uloborus diversus TaxID=327109 RepID=UPI00240995FA|nr:macrophage mannose receptor 1-like [Uloborus diversus]
MAKNRREFIPEELSDAIMACSKGWYLFNNKCYKFGGKNKRARKSWQKASEECSNLGGTLASIHSQEEQNFINATFLLEVERFGVWIGLNDRGKEGDYQWEDGSPVTYTYWAPNEPAGERDHNEDCVELRFFPNPRNGEWNDLQCDADIPFICQKDTIEYSVANVPLDARYCSEDNNSGWKFHNSCYNLIKEKKTWKEAEDYCRDHYSGYLVTIRDIRTDYFLDYMLKEYTEKVWIGISIKESNVQTWSSGWFVGYNRWSKQKQYLTEGTCASRLNDTPPLLTPSIEGAVCPQEAEGWKDLGGDMCYFFETEKSVTWYEASFMCLQKGGTLASIHSQAEADVLHQFALYSKDALHFGLQLHMGLHRKVQGGNEFVWSDRTPFDFKNWDSGEPNRDDESCSMVYTLFMKFHNFKCDERRGFICSIKKVLLPKEINGTLVETHEAAKNGETSVSIPTLVGILVGCLLIEAAIIVICIYYFKLRRRRAKNSSLKHMKRLSRLPNSLKLETGYDQRCVVQDDDNYEPMA